MSRRAFFMPLLQSSLASRIAFASALFGLLVAAAAIGLGYLSLSQQLDERSAADMLGRRKMLEHILSEVPSLEAIQDSRNQFADLFYGHDDLHLALTDPRTGRVLARFPEVTPESITLLAHATAADNTAHDWVAPGGQRFSGLHGSAALADGQLVRFFLSVDRHRDAALIAGFLRVTLIAVPLLLFMVAAGAGLIARTGLAPLRRFNQLAASIGAKSLTQRMPMSGLPNELEDTARELNGMLERIDSGYRQLDDFSGDLAHEMRTPVATVLGRTQVALSQARAAGELREVLEGNVEELNRLSTIIEDMLFIARAENHAIPVGADLVDLAREARTVADYLGLIAEEKGVRLQVAGEAEAIAVDRLMIQRAVSNLVSNAIRHASDGSIVRIEIGGDSSTTTLAVSNEGEVIPPANLKRIFDRFYRVDSARARAEGGSGLGLAIVRSIMTAHRGEVAARSESGKSTFTLSFPAAADARRRITAL